MIVQRKGDGGIGRDCEANHIGEDWWHSYTQLTLQYPESHMY
jgi:hypothetical protein